jgi:hypothetical protein
LYKDNQYYVPELYMSQEALLNREKNPYFEHAEADYFLARDKQGKIVGRIMATVNQTYLDFTGHKAGFFGFFEVINDQNLAFALLDTAKNWLKERNMPEMIGPCNFSTNETCGLLIENFEKPPALLTTYNFEYYVSFVDAYGMTKMTDLLTYDLPAPALSDKLIQTSALLEERLAKRGITLRKINMKNFDADIERFLEIYNASWDNNLGFVPMSPNEVRHMGKDLKGIVDPDFVLFAEKDGKPIGLSLTLPDFNEVLINVKRGRLLPFGIFKILLNKSKIKRLRTVALGILPEYRRTGLDMVMYVHNFLTTRRKGLVGAEASWILEANLTMNRAIVSIGGVVDRKHRIYTKHI